MLLMIQRVFYGHIGMTSDAQPARDLNAREHLSLWPIAALMVLMGVASPYWMHTLDANGRQYADKPLPVEAQKGRSALYSISGVADPELKQAADRALAGKPALPPMPGPDPVPNPEGRRY
jgi:NADH-quinone oxidoreductase subunit M